MVALLKASTFWRVREASVTVLTPSAAPKALPRRRVLLVAAILSMTFLPNLLSEYVSIICARPSDAAFTRLAPPTFAAPNCVDT
jgi:hypothetical protein